MDAPMPFMDGSEATSIHQGSRLSGLKCKKDIRQNNIIFKLN